MRNLFTICLLLVLSTSLHAVQVKQKIRCADGTICERVIEKPEGHVIGSSVGQPTKPADEFPEVDGVLVICRNARAYRHALREAKLLARMGRSNYPGRYGGHPLGCAPGTSRSGTGFSWNPNRPNHCYLGELPRSRIIARARVIAADGSVWWSAHY